MGKITLELDNGTDAMLRTYLRNNYLRSHGQLTKVVAAAIREYVDRQKAFDYIDQIGIGRHVLLLYQDEELARRLELGFLLNGLRRGFHASYLISEGEAGASVIPTQMDELAGGLGATYDKEKFHVLGLPRLHERSKNLGPESWKVVMGLLGGNVPSYVVAHFYSPSGGAKDRTAEIAVENELSQRFREFPGSFMCNFNVRGLNPADIAQWYAQEVSLHHDVVVCLENKVSTYKAD